MLQTNYLQNPINHSDDQGLAREQLSIIRDEWLAPLLAQLNEQSRDMSSLEVRYRQLVNEYDQLARERDELAEQLETMPEPTSTAPSTTTEMFMHLANQLRTTEGAVVTGIAIAIGLWAGIGLMMLLILG